MLTQKQRYKSCNKNNGSLQSTDVDKYTSLSKEASDFLLNAAKRLDLSARAYFKVIKVARTIADLELSRDITVPHIAESLQYRQITLTQLLHPLFISVKIIDEINLNCASKGELAINKSIRINGAIRARELRVIGPGGEQLGIMPLKDAQRTANEAGLDLVEISPDADPPVAKIIDWGKYQYQKMKDMQRNKRAAKSGDLKQMRFGLKIGAGDLDVKLRKIRTFLEGGHKVRIQVVYKGREMAHKEIGYELIEKITTLLDEVAVIEQKPQMAGRNLSIIIRSK